jgi:hypothetical protein
MLSPDHETRRLLVREHQESLRRTARTPSAFAAVLRSVARARRPKRSRGLALGRSARPVARAGPRA